MARLVPLRGRGGCGLPRLPCSNLGAPKSPVLKCLTPRERRQGRSCRGRMRCPARLALALQELLAHAAASKLQTIAQEMGMGGGGPGVRAAFGGQRAEGTGSAVWPPTAAPAGSGRARSTGNSAAWPDRLAAASARRPAFGSLVDWARRACTGLFLPERTGNSGSSSVLRTPSGPLGD